MEYYNRELFISPELREKIERQLPKKEPEFPPFKWSDDGFIVITKPDPRELSWPTTFTNTNNGQEHKKS